MRFCAVSAPPGGMSCRAIYIPCGYFFRDPGTARGYVTAAGRIFPGGTGREDFFPVRVPDGTDAAEAAFVLRTALGSAGIAEEPEYIQDGPLAGCFRIPLPAGTAVRPMFRPPRLPCQERKIRCTFCRAHRSPLLPAARNTGLCRTVPPMPARQASEPHIPRQDACGEREKS